MPGAFHGLIWANPVEIVAASALERLDLTAQGNQERFESGLGIQAWIDQNLVSRCDHLAALDESEGEPGGELKAAFFMRSASCEVDIDGLLYDAASG